MVCPFPATPPPALAGLDKGVAVDLPAPDLDASAATAALSNPNDAAPEERHTNKGREPMPEPEEDH